MTPSQPTSDLFTAPEMRSSPSPLTMARRRLDELQARAASLLDQATEDGTEGELEQSAEWRELRRQLKAAAGTVAAEELVAMGKGAV